MTNLFYEKFEDTKRALSNQKRESKKQQKNDKKTNNGRHII